MARGSRGPAGYPDWQRQVTTVSPTLTKKTLSIEPAPTTIGPVYVGNFASLTGTIETGGEPASSEKTKLTFDWFTDKQLNQSAGRVECIMVDFLHTNRLQFLLPNQGAWARIVASGIGESSKHNVGWVIAATGREQLNVNPPEKPTLLSGEGKLGISGAAAWVPAYNFAGPVLVSFRANKLNVLLHLSGFIVTSGSATALATHQTTEAGVYEEFTWLTPLGSWEAIVINQSGEECEYAFQMTPAISGSG